MFADMTNIQISRDFAVQKLAAGTLLGLPGQHRGPLRRRRRTPLNFLMFLGFSPGSGQWRGPDQERVQPDEEHHVEEQTPDHGDHIVAP